MSVGRLPSAGNEMDSIYGTVRRNKEQRAVTALKEDHYAECRQLLRDLQRSPAPDKPVSVRSLADKVGLSDKTMANRRFGDSCAKAAAEQIAARLGITKDMVNASIAERECAHRRSRPLQVPHQRGAGGRGATSIIVRDSRSKGCHLLDVGPPS